MTTFPQLEPFDKHNQALQSNVHPPDWVNPTPAPEYHLVVLGAGTAGLVTAAGAAGLGAKVALVERELMGGDCLNVGCVPSKAVISAARAAATVKGAGEFGIQVPAGTTTEFSAVMQRMRRLRSEISPADSAARFRDLGVDVFLGSGQFTAPGQVAVGDATLRFKKAVVATGARAAAPPIDGLDQVDYLTNETLFSLTEIPARLAIIGAGPIGCEMAQSFSRLGSEVFLIESTHGILPREDPDAAKIVEQSLKSDGVKLLCCGKKLKLSRSGELTRLQVESHDEGYDVEVDHLLVSAGRSPNVDGLGLETVGVEYDRRGIKVNDKLQTTNPKIYAAGDVCSKYQFTHAADFMARTVIRNAMFLGRAKVSDLVIPWCTYTSPEIAHVGMTLDDAKRQGVDLDTYVQEFAHIDRAILEGETNGLVKVHVKKGTDQILGATIVATNAGDMISEITLAMTHGLGLGKIADAIHPYPTQAEAIRKVGDQYRKTRLTSFNRGVLDFVRWIAGMN